MLAVVGFFHAGRQPFDGVEPMFVHLERRLPGLANGVLEHPARPVHRPHDVLFRLPRETPAVVPLKS